MATEQYAGLRGDGGAQLARFAAKPKRLSVVVPCFNEEDGLGELVRRVTAACAGVVATPSFGTGIAYASQTALPSGVKDCWLPSYRSV